ncbi:MAG TPA: hypothetical protein VIH59_18025 [Candidatus Tectomicrobia bacterium]|jgi:hypothetical protein
MAEGLNLHFEFPDTQTKEKFKSAFQSWLKQYEQQVSQQTSQQAGLAGGQQAPAVESYGFGPSGQGAGAGLVYINFIPRW